jgi:hypothetical protein
MGQKPGTKTGVDGIRPTPYNSTVSPLALKVLAFVLDQLYLWLLIV